MCLTVAWSSVMAQDRSITGKVTAEEDGAALPGVNVVLKGSTTGTVTDVDGVYKLSVPPDGGTLVFSFIGLTTQEIVIGERSVVDIKMGMDIQQLGEVVVTAAGIEREKKSLGYRMENVSGSKLQQVSETDPLRALQGKVAGVNIIGSSGVPGSSTRITMRGNRSLLGNNQPLIVVDGIPFDNTQTNTSNQLVQGGAYGSGLAAIDPNNIESMNILPPGGAGAALYGVRAANGVIVITTKTGTSRASKKGTGSSSKLKLLNRRTFRIAEYQNKIRYGYWISVWTGKRLLGCTVRGCSRLSNNTEIPLWTDIAAAFPDKPATVPYRAYPNNVKDFFNHGYCGDNSVTLTGGNEKSISRLPFPTTIKKVLSRNQNSTGLTSALEQILYLQTRSRSVVRCRIATAISKALPAEQATLSVMVPHLHVPCTSDATGIFRVSLMKTRSPSKVSFLFPVLRQQTHIGQLNTMASPLKKAV
jgi:TonB-dependent SusC/RagA subfamily outer membrane receptor